MIYDVGINDMPRGWTRECKWNQLVYRKWYSMFVRCYSEKFHEKRPTYKDCYVCERWLLFSNFISDFKLINGYDEEKFLNGELELDKDIKSNGKNKEYSLENCMLVSALENVKQATKTRDYTFGENHPLYGKNHSEETKRKISKANKGNHHSEETKQKMSIAKKGKRLSEEIKQNMSNAKRGENHPNYGKHLSEETKQKISNTNSIKIKQENKNGDLIKIWNGSHKIERETGIKHGSIIACCKWYACGENIEEWYKTHKSHPIKSAGGFIWKYYEEEDYL